MARGVGAERVLGVVLAGGQGRRCGGRDKAWLRLRGRPLLCHAVERLCAQVEQVVVSANRHRWACRRLGLASIPDPAQWAGRGPLAAIAAAWMHYPGRTLAIVPVDCPLAPVNHVAKLRAVLAGGVPVAALRCGGRVQPLFALIAPVLEEDAIAALQSPRPPPMWQWLEAAGVSWLDWPDPDGWTFANINRLDDLRDLEAACARA